MIGTWRPKLKTIQVDVEAQLRCDNVINAALKWFSGKRPVAYTKKEHCENSEVNTCNDGERRLARAVAEYIKWFDQKDE
jgi:hypothetical protein